MVPRFMVSDLSYQVQERDRLAALQVVRNDARAGLPAEPDAAAPGDSDAAPAVVLVRVRLPCGSMQQRRFAPGALISDVRLWVSTLEEMPLDAAADSDTWRLVTSYPRSQPEKACSVAEISGGANAMALFVEMD